MGDSDSHETRDETPCDVTETSTRIRLGRLQVQEVRNRIGARRLGHQCDRADEPTRNVSLLCRSGLGSKIDTQGFSALIYQLCARCLSI